MEIEDLVNEIIERVLHSDPVHSDEFVNERIIRADVWSLIETYTSGIVDARTNELEIQIESLKDDIKGLHQ